jgi:enoyl-CoA hydratase/carnithine racemase
VVGVNTALDWSMTGRQVSAHEAQQRGLVSEIVPADQVGTRARQIALGIAEGCSLTSVALARQLVWRMLEEDHPMAAHRRESQSLQYLGKAADIAEGVRAFREKRPPRFSSTVDDLPGWFPWWQEPEWEESR